IYPSADSINYYENSLQPAHLSDRGFYLMIAGQSSETKIRGLQHLPFYPTALSPEETPNFHNNLLNQQIINYLKEDKTARLISELSAGPIIAGYDNSAGDDLLDKTRLVADCIKKIKTKNLRRTRLSLQRKIKMAEDKRNVKEQMRLLNEFQNLMEKV
ncbi:unnamed protein product, partial [marine sediment metagenome]